MINFFIQQTTKNCFLNVKNELKIDSVSPTCLWHEKKNKTLLKHFPQIIYSQTLVIAVDMYAQNLSILKNGDLYSNMSYLKYIYT